MFFFKMLSMFHDILVQCGEWNPSENKIRFQCTTPQSILKLGRLHQVEIFGALFLNLVYFMKSRTFLQMFSDIGFFFLSRNRYDKWLFSCEQDCLKIRVERKGYHFMFKVLLCLIPVPDHCLFVRLFRTSCMFCVKAQMIYLIFPKENYS